MLSKIPLAPKPNPQDCNKMPLHVSDGQSQTKPQDAATVISEPDTATEENVVEQIAEETAQTVLPEANAAAEVAGEDTGNRLVRRLEQQQTVVGAAQKPTDDRLFTWAAIGLTIAIVVLLLKKFVRSSGHGAVFMDES